MDQTPIGKKVAAIEKKFKAATEQATTAQNEYRNEYLQIERSPDYREYLKKRRELAEKEDSTWEIERKAMAEAARKIYAARHNELTRLAVIATPETQRLGFDVLSYPRVDGSTSTQPLSVIIASRILGTSYEWIYPEPYGSPYRERLHLPDDLLLYDVYDRYGNRADIEFTMAASQAVAKPARPGQERLVVMINSLLAASSSTHDAYTNLVARKCDLNLTARPPSREELALASQKGVNIELRPIARDALVFIVNYRNPVKTISREQLVRIYQGNLKSWSELGGPATNVTAFWRERESGSRELFDTLVTPGKRLSDPERSRELFSNSMGGPFSQVNMNPHGIGYSVYYYEHFMSLSPYTRKIGIDGVEPTPETIASGKYPYVAEVYAAYRADEPKDGATMKLLNWLLSREGQAVVRESGYVPIE